MNTEFTFADIRDSVTETRVEALAGFGFTERQRRFLVTVMVHSGCFLERQYCAFTGTARGQNSREFMARLVTRGFVRVIEPGPVRRGRLYHIHHKPLYEAIGQADNRNRRLRHIGRMVERVMMLDAVLGDRRCWRLSPADDKWRFFCLKRDNYLKADDYPHIAFGTGRKRTVRCFPDKLPIGIEKDDYDRLVFLYLVNRRLPVDFRQFLIRHAKLFGFVTTWTVRLLVPRRFRKAVAVYKAAVREELWTPMNPSVCTRLETYFAQCRAAGRHIADPDDRYIREEFRKQGMPKVQALYRAWRRDGDLVLWWASSTTLRDARELGRSRLEIELLNRQYLQLTGTMDRDVLERRGAKRKSRQVGPPVSTPDSDSLSPLVGDAREPQATLPDAAYFAARRQARRRSVPTRPSTLMPKSPLERWRERPRYRARHLTPGCPDGVVHAIAGRRPCPCLRARPCGRIAPPMSAISAARSDRRSVPHVCRKNRVAHEPNSSSGHDHDRCAIGARIEPHHHRADDAGAVLGVFNALRFAPTRPVAGPSGIDDASARHRWAMTRWWIDLMRRRTRTTLLTTTSRGRMLTSFRQCRTALLRSATTASGARIPPIATRARFGAHHSQHRSPLQNRFARMICTP